MYWCLAERSLRAYAFNRYAASEEKSVSVSLSGRLFVIACKQARHWMRESDYALDASETPISALNIYTNISHQDRARKWLQSMNISSESVKSTIQTFADDNASKTAHVHPLRFIHPRDRHMLAAYLLLCVFHVDATSIALLPPDSCLDIGYAKSTIVHLLDPSKQEDFLDDIKQLFVNLRIENGHTGWEYIRNSLSVKIDLDQVQAVPGLTDELDVMHLPNGDIAVKLSKYFSVQEVLNPGFFTRPDFNELNITIVEHAGFGSSFLPGAPNVAPSRVIEGVVKRGTISTLLISPSDETLQPADVFYASKQHVIAPRVDISLTSLVEEMELRFFPNGLADELAFVTPANTMKLLVSFYNEASLIPDFFKKLDQLSKDLQDDAALLYDAYSMMLAFLGTYKRHIHLSDALCAFTEYNVVRGPSANNGSVVYPIYRNLSANGGSADVVIDPSSRFVRVFATYKAIDMAAIGGKNVVDIPKSSDVLSLPTYGGIGPAVDETKFMRHSGIGSMFASAFANLPSGDCLTDLLPTLECDTTDIGKMDTLRGIVSTNPFMVDRTCRSFEITLPRNRESVFYDPVRPGALQIRTYPRMSNATDHTVVINAQYTRRGSVNVVQGRDPKLTDRDTHVALSNIDYMITPTWANKLFLLQARYDTTRPVERRAFSWFVARYLGVDAYNQDTVLTIPTDAFMAIKSADDIFAGPDAWIDDRYFFPLLSTSSESIPSQQVQFSVVV